MDVRVGQYRRLSTEELMLLNCGVGEDCWESLGQLGDQTSQPERKSILNFHAEAEAPVLWSPDAKDWLIGKDLDAGKDWRREEKGKTEDEMVEWHHRLDEHEFKQAPGVGDAGMLQSTGSQSQAQLNDWAELMKILFPIKV